MSNDFERKYAELRNEFLEEIGNLSPADLFAFAVAFERGLTEMQNETAARALQANYLKVNLPAGNDAQKSFAKEEKAALERMQHLVALNSFLPVIKRYEDLIAEVLKPAAPVVSIVKPPAS